VRRVLLATGAGIGVLLASAALAAFISWGESPGRWAIELRAFYGFLTLVAAFAATGLTWGNAR
jgi:hypothetical protein